MSRGGDERERGEETEAKGQEGCERESCQHTLVAFAVAGLGASPASSSGALRFARGMAELMDVVVVQKAGNRAGGVVQRWTGSLR